MPDVRLWQPEPEGNPIDRWEFRFQPLGQDGHPNVAATESLVYSAGEITTFTCSGEWLRPYCTEKVAAEAQPDWPVSHFDAQVTLCTLEERTCYTVPVEDPSGPNGWISARAFGSVEGISEWSAPLTVPEPDVAFSLMLGAVFLGAILHEHARERRRARALRGVWQPRQRGTLRGRLREVLRRGLRLVGVGR